MDKLFDYESTMKLVVQADGCSVYQMRSDTGEGTMTMYDVFPGVVLIYCDFHMRVFDSDFNSADDLFCIDHCREGRLEYEADESAYSYVEAGDLKLDTRRSHTGRFFLPLSHYHGITIGLRMREAAQALPNEVKGFPIDLYKLQKKFCSGHFPVVVHNAPSIVHIMGELYAVPEKIRIPYFKVKILELLLYLDALELPSQAQPQPYFYKSQVEKIKAMHQLMTENLDRHFTAEELSLRFDIPLTSLKSCFKTVYGHPINTYMRIFRMNRAAVYLKRDKNASVTEIAGRVGYDSASKFAAAFKSVIGSTPLAYRKNEIPHISSAE